MAKNYLTYPCKYMNISQSYNGTYSHTINSQGNPADYPIDEACKDTGRDYFYCPCDEMEVVRIYGVGNSGTNTLWLTSTSKVDMPSGNDYITILVMHPEDDDLSLLKVGQKFKRGEPICREGMDGNATGYHFHLSFGTGHSKGNGWVLNNKGAWVLSVDGKTIKPEDACYIDTEFTSVINKRGINFVDLPNKSESAENKDNSITLGIDVSKHNGTINWDKVAKDGIKFAIMRAGYGSADSQIDGKFHENMEGALKAGLDVGCYWFSYAINEKDVRDEAALCAKVIERYKGRMNMPVFYDLEYDSFNYAKKYGVTITKKLATQFAKIFCEEMKKYGWYCGNYTNLDCYKNYFDSAELSGIDVWYADWRTSVTEPSVNCTIWQYSSTGNISGISGNVDMDLCYIDYPSIIRNMELNGFTSVDDDETSKNDSFLEQLNTLRAENDELKKQIYEMTAKLNDIKDALQYAMNRVESK